MTSPSLRTRHGASSLSVAGPLQLTICGSENRHPRSESYRSAFTSLHPDAQATSLIWGHWSGGMESLLGAGSVLHALTITKTISARGCRNAQRPPSVTMRSTNL